MAREKEPGLEAGDDMRPSRGYEAMIDPKLKQDWRKAIYSLDTDAGTVQFRIGQQPVGAAALQPCRSVTIVTAWNPKCRNQPRADNDRAQARLVEYIREKRYRFVPANGSSEDGSDVEESLAVFDLDEEEAHALGAKFGQGAVMFWDGGDARLIWMCEVAK